MRASQGCGWGSNDLTTISFEHSAGNILEETPMQVTATLVSIPMNFWTRR